MFEDGEGFFVAPQSTHTAVVPGPMPNGSDNGCPATTPLSITCRCVKELSPLDMIDMSNGVADATGHKVWLGARLFVALLERAPGLRAWAGGKACC